MSDAPNPPDDPSQDLLDRWQETGDPEALDALLRLEMGILKGIISGRAGGLLKQSLGVTDVAHEAVLGLLRVNEPPSFDNPRALRGYLWKSAWRLLVQRLDRRGARPLQLDGTQSQGFQSALATSGGIGAAFDSDQSVALQLAMNLLLPEERSILEMHYMRFMDLAAIGKELGVSSGAARMRLSRARRALAAKIGGWSDFIG